MIKLLLISFLFTNEIGYVSLKPTNAEISYCKLDWSLFNLKPPVTHTVAQSVTGIGYSYDGLNSVKVFCVFDKNASYVTIKGRNSYVLNHEQRHFDISYIYAKILVKQLSEQKQLNEQIVDKIYDKILSEKNKVQSAYDKETNNSENKGLQDSWDLKIDNLLNNL